MTLKSILTRTARGLVVTVAAAGLFAGAAVMPASAATPAAEAAVAGVSARSPMVDGRFTGSAPAAAAAATNARVAAAAALGSRITFAAACSATSATMTFGMAMDALAGYTYAVRFDAYQHSGNGWRWIGAVSGFYYGKIVPGSYYLTDPLRTIKLPSTGFYSFYAEIYVWTGTQWAKMDWQVARHSQLSTGRAIQDASWCGAFTNI